MRKPIICSFNRCGSYHYIDCDQYPLEKNNVSPETGFPYSDVTLFQLAQQGLANFDINRISELPEVGSQTTFDTLHSKHVSTPKEKMEAMMHDYNVLHPKKEEKVEKVVAPIAEPAAVSEPAAN